MVFDDLAAGVVRDEELKSSIAKLAALKRSGAELDNGARIPAIHAFLEREIVRLEEIVANTHRKPVSAELQEKMNRYFRETLNQQS